MKTNLFYRWIHISIIVCTFGIVLSSCEKIEEIPPRQEGSADRAYKMPDPTPLTIDELTIVEQIREEYKNNVN